MNYIDEIAAALHEIHPSIDLDVDPAMARGYALLVLTTGEATTSRQVHDVWSMVRLATRPDHPSIVPFEQLSRGIQGYDEVFGAAIRQVARNRRVSFQDATAQTATAQTATAQNAPGR